MHISYWAYSLSLLQLVDAGDDVLLLYNEQTLPQLVQLMKSSRMKADKAGELAYHISLIHLLTLCTEGKNVFTEIKCHSLVPLDDILHIVTHQDCIPEVCPSVSLSVSVVHIMRWYKCISECVCVCVYVCVMWADMSHVSICHPQVKNVYVQFLMHAYIDTDVELREVYSRDTMWELFENFLPDISTVSDIVLMCTDLWTTYCNCVFPIRSRTVTLILFWRHTLLIPSLKQSQCFLPHTSLRRISLQSDCRYCCRHKCINLYSPISTQPLCNCVLWSIISCV